MLSKVRYLPNACHSATSRRQPQLEIIFYGICLRLQEHVVWDEVHVVVGDSNLLLLSA